MTNEVRVDPLTGLKTIIAPDRAGRPGDVLRRRPVRADRPATDPFAEGHEHQTPPELHAVRPGGGAARHTRLDGARRAQPLPGRRRPTATAPARDAQPDLFTAQAAAGRPRGDRQRARRRWRSLAELEAEQVAAAVDAWRERMRAHDGAAYLHLIVNERREAGASLPHTHAQLYALDFVPAGVARERERFGAHAVRTMGGNLLADLVQEEVRRRERLVAVDDEAVLMAPYASRLPYQLMLAPRRAARPLRGRRAVRRRAAARRAAAPARAASAPRRRSTCGSAPRRAGRTHFCWRIDILPRLTPLAGLELGTGLHLCVVAPGARRRRAARRLTCARSCSASRAPPCPVGGARSPRSARACSSCSASPTTTTARDADRLADKVRALRVFPDADGRMNEPLGDREVLCVSQFTLYGDARKGNRPVVRRRRPARARRAAVRALLRRGSARRAACSARTWRSSSSTTAR